MFGPMKCLYGAMLFVLFLVNVQRISLRRWTVVEDDTDKD